MAVTRTGRRRVRSSDADEVTNGAIAVAWERAARELAGDVLVLAALGGMPDTFWLTDRRIRRAAVTLQIPLEVARTRGRRQADAIRARRDRQRRRA